MNLVLEGAPWRHIRKYWRSAIGPILVATLVAGAAFYFFNRPAPVAPAPPTATVERANITQVILATGRLQPRLKVDVGAQVGGQVRQLHVQLGQVVKAGALLVSMDSESARNAVQQAEAALAQQAAIVTRTRVDLEAARNEDGRQHRLLANDATSLMDMENANTALTKLEAELQGQEATLVQRRADLADKKLKLSYTRVSSPIDGEVVNIAAQEGQTVNALQSTPTLLTLAQLNTMTVKAKVAEAEIGLVKVGQAARVTTLAANSRHYEGKVRVVQPIPESSGNALFYPVLFEIDNADHQLLSDMTVQVELEVDRANQVPSLPIIALDQRDSSGLYTVQVLDAAGKASPRQVRIGIRDDAHAQVLAGLKVGERVLLAPASASPAPAHP
jgi:macrolide-specific efflux system membrane fusion protein